jgi:hypothetical protein
VIDSWRTSVIINGLVITEDGGVPRDREVAVPGPDWPSSGRPGASSEIGLPEIGLSDFVELVGSQEA